jgi:DNA-binding HxlR family transcriptional regulator
MLLKSSPTRSAWLSLDRSPVMSPQCETTDMEDPATHTTDGLAGNGLTEDQLPVNTPGEEWCPVLATRTLLGNRWAPAIVARLLEEPHRFVALRDALPGVSGKVLSDTLDRLVERGIVERRQSSSAHHPVEYTLTERGRSLRPLVTAMREWGDEQVVRADDPEVAEVHV